MSTPELEHDVATERRPRHGLAIASVSLSAVAAVLALATWVAWLVVRAQMQGVPPYSWISQVFVLVLGALWFAMIPAGVLSIIFGYFAGARLQTGSNASRLGLYLGLLTIAIALAGAAVFTLTPSAWTTPDSLFPPGTYGTYFNR
ncbi:hypothetical protein ACFWY9_26370 [Amycolatopsis sp. NPDC059027]|uniref:hypothetical protein n=1 Tax=unclassified Amycolatopsis TaxID=2618356 RepID=UPI003672956B